jgi:hypothetical protein
MLAVAVVPATQEALAVMAVAALVLLLVEMELLELQTLVVAVAALGGRARLMVETEALVWLLFHRQGLPLPQPALQS